MTLNSTYEAQKLNPAQYKIFAGVYSDFRATAADKYKFELEPLCYEDFINSIEKGLISCIVLLENNIPTAFLVYTTVISEAIELNMIHCLGEEELVEKRKLLLEKFLEETKELRNEKIVCYPMIGPQSDFVTDITRYGFKFIGIAVLRFFFKNENCEGILKTAELAQKDSCFQIVEWSDDYFEDAIQVVHSAFENSSDALFDPRFKTLEGVRDILGKIADSTYGEFIPDATSVFMHSGKPCGFCFVNITAGKIANVPIFAIAPEYQGKGFSKHLLKKSISTLSDWTKSGKRDFTEINTTTETDNYKALKMYRSVGFQEDYAYAQSYLDVQKNCDDSNKL